MATLEKTNKETQYGRLIYKNTDTGELHSELSLTFEYPKGSGRWVNMPSIHRGHIYNEDELRNMLKQTNSIWLEGGITSSHSSEAEALKAAKQRSANMKYSPIKNISGYAKLSDASQKLIFGDGTNMGHLKEFRLNEKKLAQERANQEQNKFAIWSQNEANKAQGVWNNTISKLTNLKNTQIADYGEMPGFRWNQAKGQKSDQGYYDVDETSPFWQTDAGYDKAMQTWGEKPGWVKPGYRPKKKELDVEAIKKWFKPSK